MGTSTLKTLRIKRGKTQDEASIIFGITKEYLSMIENGKRNPSDKLKEKMANFYEVSMYDIFLAINQTKRFK